jgi:hypothetical protein
MARDHFKKLWSTILSNGVRQDSEGNWTVINSSTNKRRMEKTGSSVGGASGPSSQEWIPAKIYVTPEELAEIWEKQGGKCYWFNIPLDITLLYKDHKDTKENIVICTRFANFGRNVCEFDKFHEIVDILQGKQSTKNIVQLSLFN